MITTLGPTDEQVRTMRHNIMEQISTDALDAPTQTTTYISRRRKIAFAAVGVAAAAALVVGSALIPSGAGSSANAAIILSNAAAAAITTSDVVAGPGQFLKIETRASYGIVGENADGDKVSWLAPEITTVYKPADPVADWVMERRQLIPTEFYGAGAETVAMGNWEEAQTDPLTNGTFRAQDAAFYGTADPATSTDGLPRDAKALYDYIRAEYSGGSNSAEEDAWVRITALLRTGTAPAELRSALYGAAAMIPGITVIPGEVTLDGRTGVAIGRLGPSRNQRQDIIIDTVTGELIGERTVMTEDGFGAPAGTTWAATSVTTTVVSSAP
jgi:RNA polymerase sigma-70 factor (ECF subfamily)